MDFQIYQGEPTPLGVIHTPQGYNFALFSRHATRLDLCIFDDKKNLMKAIELDSRKNKTGDIWHISLNLPPESIYYGYRIKGPDQENFFYRYDKCMLDPYTRIVSSRDKWRESKETLEEDYRPLGMLPFKNSFDWEQVSRPCLPKQDLIIYEMHVRGFTAHSSSLTKNPGTFLGVIEKIPYLLELGVNAVEFLPLQEFDENEVRHFSNKSLHGLCNYWGYSTVNFFSPMARYATSSKTAVYEFKSMVKELHKNGIEVILDIVFNHTAEGSEAGPVLSFKGIDAPIYYLYDTKGKMSNYSGCGNTFNCNQPIVRKLIIDCLHYWALEMHVDGFRFDLASILQRDTAGIPLNYSPLVEEITEDPLLRNIKLIAEPWDAAGLYEVGRFVTQNKRWSEWNGKYRDTVRKFIKGEVEVNLKGDFITKICGSQDLYWNRSPLSSLNFITAHDGFTLHDLVSYNNKHNEGNGENDEDGNPINDSWNCGVEGNTIDKDVLALREQQMRNFHLALMISQGIPMLLMGDEYGHTRKGNNNPWCQDNELNWFLWEQIETHASFHRFYKKLIHFRKTRSIFKRTEFLKSEDVQWHGLEPFKPNWDSAHHLVAFTLLDHVTGKDLYIVFNSDECENKITMPSPKKGMQWFWIVNTANSFPNDFFDEAEAPCLFKLEFVMPPYSACLLESRPYVN